MLDLDKPVRHSFSKGPAKILEVREDGYVWYTYKDVIAPKDERGYNTWVEPFLTHRSRLPLENIPERRTLLVYLNKQSGCLEAAEEGSQAAEFLNDPVECPALAYKTEVTVEV